MPNGIVIGGLLGWIAADIHIFIRTKGKPDYVALIASNVVCGSIVTLAVYFTRGL
jgi:hypothetical protein